MSDPFQRALVIRGGALGDFLLTLPVLASLRDAAPAARLEVLAYPGPASLARLAGLVDGVKTIEYGPLAGFFSRGTQLDPALAAYFASFDAILSYLYDPDGIFSDNLRACGVRTLIPGPHKVSTGAHAIDQLAAPLSAMSLPLTRRAVQLDLGVEPRNPAALAIHPGSGSLSKNWPPARWRTLAESMLSVLPADATLAVIGGEADAAALDPLRSLASDQRVVFWENLPLAELAAKLAGCRCFAGHDTGVSHLAATTGTPALLLFGPTDPGVWAPPHAHVQVLRAPGGNWDDLLPDAVAKALGRLFLPARLASSQAGG